jgi:hypothetical protein
MNWPLAISRNRSALLAVVASIFAMIGGRVLRPVDAAAGSGLGVQGTGGMISRRLRNAALALLRPAESAMRRLIVMAARGVLASPRAARAFPGGLGSRTARGLSRPRAFRLFDPPKRYASRRDAARPRGVPRIRNFLVAQAAPPAAPVAMRPTPDAPVDAGPIQLRLAALGRALADLPRQAKRLARWRAKQRLRPDGQPRRPLRLGRPPGWRAGARRAVDVVLMECDRLALDVLAGPAPGPDTS